MKRAILMSIQPKWLAKILNCEKTIEIRKTVPKCELPIDVYLYCTKSKPYLMVGRNDNKTYLDNGGKKSVYSPNHNYIGNRKIVAKFTLNKVDTFDGTVGHPQLYINACVDDLYCLRTYGEVNAKKLYAYHIDNLVIFDKPKELSEFYKSRFEPNKITDAYEKTFQDLSKYRVTKAPQSWQYVYVKGE